MVEFKMMLLFEAGFCLSPGSHRFVDMCLALRRAKHLSGSESNCDVCKCCTCTYAEININVYG